MGNKVKLVSNTQIYLDTDTLLGHILDIVPNFPRQYKYTIGADMQHLAVELLDEAAAAYLIRDRQKRIEHLETFQHKFITLKTLVRKAGERHWITSKGRHAQIIELMDAIGKQCTAWKNSLASVKEDKPE